MRAFPSIRIGFACLMIALMCGLVLARPDAQNQRQLKVTPGGRRIALVIGNAAYQLGRLHNPVNDAHDIANFLRAVLINRSRAGKAIPCFVATAIPRANAS